ncbi:carbonic anhydrase [Elioraea rosea]|uniref:carbonic anhydrase n=1 Tax=Elioraea rosea TaxID=2492390 RepID=UPI0011833398|nr:carbonic anhydrase [Elioraea rosea]
MTTPGAALARLVEGFDRFRAAYFETDHTLFDQLVWEGQKPQIMVVGCSDSRADPTMITDAGPGDVFVIRNVAALVPPYMPDGRLAGVSSALEFGVKGLAVSHIVVLGHAMCGGVRSLMEYGDADPRFEFMGRWVGLLAEAREEVRMLVTEAEPALLARYAERASVLVSLRNLMTYPWVADRVRDGTLALHGWYFDFTWGVLMAAEGPRGPFRQLESTDRTPEPAIGATRTDEAA